MAKIMVAGDAVVVTSDMKLEDIKLVKKYRPEALTLFEGEGEEKEPVFKIGIGDGGIGKYGAEFDQETRDDEKLATLTTLIPAGTADAKAYVSDAFGRAILKLNKLEATLPGVIEEIAAEKAAIEANITVAQ